VSDESGLPGVSTQNLLLQKAMLTSTVGQEDKAFPGIEPSHLEPVEEPRGRTMARNNRAALCPFYLQALDNPRRVGILRSRQSGEQRSKMTDNPTIESALAGPHFRLDNGEINFAAMNRAGIISRQELEELMREVFLPLKVLRKSSAGQSK